jgi:hypothetical protein
MQGMLRPAVCIVLAALAGAASAQQSIMAQGNGSPDRDAINAGTVTVITAPIGGPMSIMGSDMAAVLDGPASAVRRVRLSYTLIYLRRTGGLSRAWRNAGLRRESRCSPVAWPSA